MEIYLDNAATSHPKPESVAIAVAQALSDGNANPGRSSHPRAIGAGRTLLSCRESVAAAVGASTDDIIFTFNCTDSLNLAIRGLLRPGDHVIATYLEHNSVLRTLTGLLVRQAIQVTLIPPEADGFISPQAVIRALKPNTRLVICTHVSNVTGAIQPVSEIGKRLLEKGVYFLVDGAQALGSIPVDVRSIGCQLYAFPGHKGLLGPQGTGGLYIAPDLELLPLREGGTGSDSDRICQPLQRPERYESGTVNFPGLCGLLAGSREAMSMLPDTMRAESALTTQLYEGLTQMQAEIYTPPQSRTGVISFNLNGLTSTQVTDQLDQRGICVRGGLHCAPLAHRFLHTLERGAVRVSVGPYNTAQHIDSLLEALQDIQRRLTS